MNLDMMGPGLRQYHDTLLIPLDATTLPVKQVLYGLNFFVCTRRFESQKIRDYEDVTYTSFILKQKYSLIEMKNSFTST